MASAPDSPPVLEQFSGAEAPRGMRGLRPLGKQGGGVSVPGSTSGFSMVRGRRRLVVSVSVLDGDVVAVEIAEGGPEVAGFARAVDPAERAEKVAGSLLANLDTAAGADPAVRAAATVFSSVWGDGFVEAFFNSAGVDRLVAVEVALLLPAVLLLLVFTLMALALVLALARARDEKVVEERGEEPDEGGVARFLCPAERLTTEAAETAPIVEDSGRAAAVDEAALGDARDFVEEVSGSTMNEPPTLPTAGSVAGVTELAHAVIGGELVESGFASMTVVIAAAGVPTAVPRAWVLTALVTGGWPINSVSVSLVTKKFGVEAEKGSAAKGGEPTEPREELSDATSEALVTVSPADFPAAFLLTTADGAFVVDGEGESENNRSKHLGSAVPAPSASGSQPTAAL